MAACLCCDANQPPGKPKVCPICGHAFQGNAWDGIDADWNAKHPAVMPYQDFWLGLCQDHR
jgi:hypothetical protein